MTDKEILQVIKRCARNDRRAQKKLYERFFPVMYSVCKRYVKNDEDVMEALNNGFLSVFKNIGQFNFEGSFEGWIKRIIIHKSIDFLRANKLYRLNMQIEDQLVMLDARSDDKTMDENLAEIEEYIEELPDLLQTIFKLYAVEGYLHREIAEMLDINENTSRWYFLSARKHLQETLKKSDVPKTPLAVKQLK